MPPTTVPPTQAPSTAEFRIGPCGGSDKSIAQGYAFNATGEHVRSAAFEPFVGSTVQQSDACNTGDGALFLDAGQELYFGDVRVEVKRLALSVSTLALFANGKRLNSSHFRSLRVRNGTTALRGDACCILARLTTLTATLVHKISARLNLTGNFSAIFTAGGNTSAAAAKLRKSLEDTLSAKLGTRVTVTSMYLGSLVATYVTEVPAGDPARASAVSSNISTLSEDQSFLSPVAAECQASGACASGIALGESAVTSMELATATPTAGPAGTAEACSSTCIALVVVCVLVGTAAVVIGAVVLLRRHRESTAAADHKRTEDTIRGETQSAYPGAAGPSATNSSSNPLSREEVERRKSSLRMDATCVEEL